MNGRSYRMASTFLFVLITIFISIQAAGADSAADLQITNASSTPISYGSTTSGAIGVPGGSNSYTFTGEDGDVILIGITQVSGDIWPRIRLYDPDGQLIADEESPVHAEISLTLRTKQTHYLPFIVNDSLSSSDQAPAGNARQPLFAATPGTYTILVSDGFNGTYTGSYSLFLQKLNPPAGATGIGFNQTLSGAISAAAEMDAFTFPASGGERVLISLSHVAGDIWPEVRLYDPDGVNLNTQDAPKHSEIAFDVPRAGDYTLLIGDGFRGAYTGSYSLFIQRLNEAVGATPIAYGQTLPGVVTYAAEMKAFTIDARSSERILIGITQVSGDIWPEIRLYDPTGLLLSQKDGPIHSEIEYDVTADGIYSVLVADGFDGTNTGSFNLFLQRLNDPAGATAIAFGETKPGSISLAAEMDAFVFDGLNNEQVQITVAKTAGDIWPQIRLYDPSGLLLNEQSGPTSSEITQVLPGTGMYTILVSDGFRGAYTGSYNLHLVKLP